MESLIIFYELFIDNFYNNNIKDLFTVLAIICGIFVINSNNPIISILFLIGLFASISIYLILIGLDFLGLSYLIVYIGAVSILFIFILMLISVRISELLDHTANSLILGIIILISLAIIFFQILPHSTGIISNNLYSYLGSIKNFLWIEIFNFNKDETLLTASNMWDSNIIEIQHISSIGNILYTSHSIWLIITSYILLLTMIGAITITLKNN